MIYKSVQIVLVNTNCAKKKPLHAHAGSCVSAEHRLHNTNNAVDMSGSPFQRICNQSITVKHHQCLSVCMTGGRE